MHRAVVTPSLGKRQSDPPARPDLSSLEANCRDEPAAGRAVSPWLKVITPEPEVGRATVMALLLAHQAARPSSPGLCDPGLCDSGHGEDQELHKVKKA